MSRAVLRQEKAITLKGMPNDSHSSALELLVVGVPRLNHTSFSLNAVVGFKSIQLIQLALVELLLLLPPFC